MKPTVTNKNKNHTFSKFLHLFNKGNTGAFYHALNLELLFFDRETAEALEGYFRTPRPAAAWLPGLSGKSYQQKVLNSLLESGMLLEEGTDETGLIESIAARQLANQGISILFLIFSGRCNFKCRYCIETTHPVTDPAHRTHMSRDVAAAAVDMFCRMQKPGPLNPHTEIRFYGGEPLLNYPVLEEVVRCAAREKEKGELANDTKLIIATNGSLLNEAKIISLKQFGVTVDLSLDGPPGLHNEYRLNKNGSGSFAQCFNAWRLLKRAGVETTIACTLTPKSLDNLDRLLAFFQQNLESPNSFRFNSLHFHRDSSNGEEYFRREAQAVITAYQLLKKHWLSGDRIDNIQRSLKTKQPVYATCDGVCRKLVISPVGKVGMCEVFVSAKEYFTASVFDKDFEPAANSHFQEWQRLSPLNRPACYNCEALGICGGGCPINAKVLHGSIWELDRGKCYHSREILKWAIWNYYENEISNHL